MKIDNTSYNTEAIKLMGFEKFKEVYRGKLKQDAKVVYNAITKEVNEPIEQVNEDKPIIVDGGSVSGQAVQKVDNGLKHKRPAKRKRD